MALQYETGHAKNVANLEKLIEQITTYSDYNPSIDNLKIPAIATLYDNSLASLNNVINKRNTIEPSEKNLKQWKKWFKKNKEKLYFDVKEQKIKIKS